MSKRGFVIVFALITTFILSSCSLAHTDINEYDIYIDEVENAGIFMPELDGLPDYESLEIYYDDGSSKSITLILQYSQDDYENAKESILNKYKFLSVPVMRDDVSLIPSPEFEYGSYIISVVNNEEFSYPENFGMIGYLDDYYRVCFLFFYDRSLNSIDYGYTMEEFVRDNFELQEE
jgi:hypothetical protein